LLVDLEQRLRRLNAASRGAADTPAQGVETVAERLQRLAPGRRTGRRSATERDEQRLAERAGGETIAPGALLIERRIGLETRHGKQRLQLIRQPITKLPEADRLQPGQLLFLDTETTGLSGGAGTHLFLLGLARLQGRQLLVRQYLLTRFSGEEALLRSAQSWLQQEDTVVSYNGKSFDLPLLISRCRLVGVKEGFSSLFHLDLLYTVRRAFGQSWEDCRLSSVERRVLGFRRHNDLPGSAAPQAWFDYMQQGDEGRLLAVIEHNFWDLVSLVMLLPLMNEIYGRPHAVSADILAIARAWQRRQDYKQALKLLQENRHRLGTAGLLELARLYKRAGHWAPAREIWGRLALQGEGLAREELAKYHEHIGHDYLQALNHALQLPCGASRERRCGRLWRKLEAYS
jgi:uncharacterized protein YprB with RNaseH-like and TPR domain